MDENNSTIPPGALGSRKAVPIPPDAIWISARQVCQRYGGRSHMWLDRKLRNNPDFPRPAYDGRIRIFRVAELDDYDRALIAARTNNNHTSQKRGGPGE
jgi:hypothetical protein